MKKVYPIKPRCYFSVQSCFCFELSSIKAMPMFIPKKIVLLLVVCMVLVSCTGLQRGVVGESLVSSARPAVEISVPSLALRTSGFTVASVTTSDALGGAPVEAWLAVYGGTTPFEPMAIVSLAVAPSTYFWDSDLSRVFSVHHGTTDFNGQVYHACTYIIEGDRDPFLTLVPIKEGAKQRYLARRFAQRTNFNENKITLEYREPLPKDIMTYTDILLYNSELISAFETRAYAAFKVGSFVPSDTIIATKYLRDVQIRYLNTNYFGTMTRVETVDTN